jgi:hypothetical protein
MLGSVGCVAKNEYRRKKTELRKIQDQDSLPSLILDIRLCNTTSSSEA